MMRNIIGGMLLAVSVSVQAAGVCDAADVGRHMREAIGHGQVCLPIADERGLAYAAEHYSDVCSAMMRSVRLANDATIRLEGHGCTVVSNGPTVGDVTVYRAMTVKMLELAGRGW